MPFQLPPLEALRKESDVEQKLVLPLLTAEPPYGFGLSTNNVHTKANIRRFTIGKGGDQKLYFPDYLLVVGGFPLIVIEAKAPGEDLLDGYREARLYATELNAVYPSGLNPVNAIVATDGSRLLAGAWDQAAPEHQLGYEDLNPYSDKMAALQALIGRASLESKFAQLSAHQRPTVLRKPRRLLGGGSVQDEEIAHNSFGDTISADFSHIFNPTTRKDRAFIATHGYIPSRRRERYIAPIDRVIRASRPPSEVNSRLIEDTGAPSEVIGALRDSQELEHKEKWFRLFEQLSPIYKWTPGRLLKVQSCPRRRASLATNAKPRWATRGAPGTSSYAAKRMGGSAARYCSSGVMRPRLE